jgi:hypothetical protein
VDAVTLSVFFTANTGGNSRIFFKQISKIVYVFIANFIYSFFTCLQLFFYRFYFNSMYIFLNRVSSCSFKSPLQSSSSYVISATDLQLMPSVIIEELSIPHYQKIDGVINSYPIKNKTSWKLNSYH